MQSSVVGTRSFIHQPSLEFGKQHYSQELKQKVLQIKTLEPEGVEQVLTKAGKVLRKERPYYSGPLEKLLVERLLSEPLSKTQTTELKKISEPPSKQLPWPLKVAVSLLKVIGIDLTLQSKVKESQENENTTEDEQNSNKTLAIA